MLFKAGSDTQITADETLYNCKKKTHSHDRETNQQDRVMRADKIFYSLEMKILSKLSRNNFKCPVSFQQPALVLLALTHWLNQVVKCNQTLTVAVTENTLTLVWVPHQILDFLTQAGQVIFAEQNQH